MNRAHVLLACCLVSASLLAACGDDDGASGPTLAGIYQVTSHTLNPTSCEETGPAAPDPYPMVLAHLQSFSLGGVSGTTMQVFDCADLAACRTLKAEQKPNAFNLSGLIFDKGSGAAGWRGTVESTVQVNGGDCQSTFQEHTFAAVPKAEGEAADAPARVRVEVRTWSATLPAGPDDGEPGPNCDDSNLEVVAKQKPCERYEVIEATLVE